MKIACLTENTSFSPDFQSEHGLSLYIEANGRKILFDMGQTALFSANAEKLGINLAEVDTAIVSHGHYDHGGGLEKFLCINGFAPVFIHRDAFIPHYNGTKKYIGLSPDLMGEKRLVFTYDEYNLGNGLILCSNNTSERFFDLGSFGLNKKIGDFFSPDDFSHEQYLIVKENGKKILISGCSHKGILNLVKWYSPDYVIGGFHFSKLACDETLEEYARILESSNAVFYTCHCTGTEQYGFMKNYMTRLNYFSCWQIITI
ncbi:MAG: MBL fold metallo-hydrolase [Clostridia bacterium]|nr:MBL fold metallo-hydrolase [Clostridia bacterium]